VARIYMLGDSHTQALGPRVKTLLGAQGHEVRFESFPGQGTRLAHQKATIPSGMDTVILALGGNDFGLQGPAREKLSLDVRKKNPQAVIYWIGPAYATKADVGVRHDQQAENQREHLPRLGVYWFDSRPITRTGHGPDGVHFKPDAYSAWAKSIATVVTVPLEPDPRPDPSGYQTVERISLGLTIAVGLFLAYKMLSREER
jgi:lysophospholipase L1-like esterase